MSNFLKKKEELKKEIKMVTYKELKEKYIDSFESKKESWNTESELNSILEEKLLNTPKLIEMYISKYGINDNIKEIIIKGI